MMTLQWLIRFNDQTFVQNQSFVHSAADARCIVSSRTGWPVSRLKVLASSEEESGGHVLYTATVTTVSAIRGGKGGFGTQLKSSGRQAGAKSTVNFGACRDLQGRRLRHVNDQAGLQIFQEWQQKIAAGVAAEEDLAKALVQTPSGVAGWHLPLTPSWGEGVSKQQKRLFQRQLRQWKREQDEVTRRKEAVKEAQRQVIDSYVTAATETSDRITDQVEDALKQGLQQRQKEQEEEEEEEKEPPEKRARVDDQNEPSDAFLTISGNIVVLSDDEDHESNRNMTTERQGQKRLKNSCRIQSQSNFASMSILLAYQKQQTDKVEEGTRQLNRKLYYEVVLETAGLSQIGWVNGGGGAKKFTANTDTGDGVGDDGNSWAYDGSRQIILNAGQEERVQQSGNAEESSSMQPWKAGDVVGCLYDRAAGSIHFSLNGQDLGPSSGLLACTSDDSQLDEEAGLLFPALSMNHGELVELCLYRESLQYIPASSDVVPVGDVLATSTTAEDIVTMMMDDEDQADGDDEDTTRRQETTTLTAVGDNITSDQKLAAVTTAEESSQTEGGSTSAKSAAPVAAGKTLVTKKPLDLDEYESVKQLEALGLDRLKGALMAIGVKCGGTFTATCRTFIFLKRSPT